MIAVALYFFLCNFAANCRHWAWILPCAEINHSACRKQLRAARLKSPVEFIRSSVRHCAELDAGAKADQLHNRNPSGPVRSKQEQESKCPTIDTFGCARFHLFGTNR